MKVRGSSNGDQQQPRITSIPQLLRRQDVEKSIGLSRSTLYALMAKGAFPAPIRVGAKAVRWRAEDVIAWASSCPSTR